MDFTKIWLHKMHGSVSLFIVLHVFMGFWFWWGCLVIYIFCERHNTQHGFKSFNKTSKYTSPRWSWCPCLASRATCISCWWNLSQPKSYIYHNALGKSKTLVQLLIYNFQPRKCLHDRFHLESLRLCHFGLSESTKWGMIRKAKKIQPEKG